MYQGKFEIVANRQQFHKLKDYDPATWRYAVIRWFNAGRSESPNIQARVVGVYRTMKEASRHTIRTAED